MTGTNHWVTCDTCGAYQEWDRPIELDDLSENGWLHYEQGDKYFCSKRCEVDYDLKHNKEYREKHNL